MIALFAPVGFLLAASLVVLSAVSRHLFWLQSLWILIGAGLVVFFYLVDWRSLLNYRWLIEGVYIGSVILLVIVLLRGPLIRNVRGWLVVGGLTIQPVELAKIALILWYAKYFSRRHLSVARLGYIFTSLLIFVAPAGLAMLSPDLGSASILFGIWFGFLLLSGLPWRRIAAAAAIFAVAGIVIWLYGLQSYQRQRVVGLLYPERDALGINYSVIQSKIAIGSAGAWGKGYGQGSQTQLRFLPEPANDFIFAALVEEWGWIVGVGVITAFAAIIWRILRIAIAADRNFEKFVCVGAVIVFSLQFFMNTGSTTGLLPVVGVNFPFLSYGGSNLLTSFFLLAIVNAIDSHS